MSRRGRPDERREANRPPVCWLHDRVNAPEAVAGTLRACRNRTVCGAAYSLVESDPRGPSTRSTSPGRRKEGYTQHAACPDVARRKTGVYFQPFSNPLGTTRVLPDRLFGRAIR